MQWRIPLTLVCLSVNRVHACLPIRAPLRAWGQQAAVVWRFCRSSIPPSFLPPFLHWFSPSSTFTSAFFQTFHLPVCLLFHLFFILPSHPSFPPSFPFFHHYIDVFEHQINLTFHWARRPNTYIACWSSTQSHAIGEFCSKQIKFYFL